MYSVKVVTNIRPNGVGKEMIFDTLEAAKFTASLLMFLTKKKLEVSGEQFTEKESEYEYHAKGNVTGFEFGCVIEEVGA